MKTLSISLSLLFFPILLLAQAEDKPKLVPASPTPSPLEVPGANPNLERTRFPGLPGRADTPAPFQPSAEVQKEFSRFVEREVDPENILRLYLGRPKLLLLKERPKRVQIPDDKTAAVDIITEREISVTGRTTGTTVLNIWFADPLNPMRDRVLSYLVIVTEPLESLQAREAVQDFLREERKRRYKTLEADIMASFPRSLVKLDLRGDMLVLSGQAHDVTDADRIARLVEAHAPRVDDKVIQTANLNLRFDLRGGELPPDLKSILESERVNVVNLLRIPGEQQVMLRVTVAEVNRAALRSIGANFAVANRQGIVFANRTGSLINNVNLGGSGGSGNTNTFSGLANLPSLIDNGQLFLAINALRNLNFARTLAEPNLTALNGRTAEFRSGGEFPVPVVTGQTQQGLQGVEFIPFGVQLRFTPMITDRDRIRLQVSSEVSTREPGIGGTVGNTSVPGRNTRNFNTEVELREGETLAVAGILQTNYGATADRVPLFGDLPLVGRLGAFDRASAGEQELVILVTPELVRPTPCHKLPPLPGAEIREPGDKEFYLLGRLEGRRAEDYRSPVRTDIHRMLRYNHNEDVFITGPFGYSHCLPGQSCP
jgi:pilus assembly protein CpaC